MQLVYIIYYDNIIYDVLQTQLGDILIYGNRISLQIDKFMCACLHEHTKYILTFITKHIMKANECMRLLIGHRLVHTTNRIVMTNHFLDNTTTKSFQQDMTSSNCFGYKVIIDHHKSTWCGNKSTCQHNKSTCKHNKSTCQHNKSTCRYNKSNLSLHQVNMSSQEVYRLLLFND